MRRMLSLAIPTAIVLWATTNSAFALAAVPEPSSMALLAGGVGAVYLARKLRRGR